MILGSLILIAAVTAAGEAPLDKLVTQPSDKLGTWPFDRLITELDDPRFSVRDRATRRLCEPEAVDLPRLVAQYRAARSEESRSRLQYAIETVFYQRELAGRCGFIGISLASETVPDVVDPENGRKVHGIYVAQVKKDFAGDRAGMRDGDVIIGLNGQSLPESNTTQPFISLIERTTPGTRVRLRVLRAESAQRTATLEPSGERASWNPGLKLAAWPIGMVGGVRVVEVEPRSAAEAAGVRVNDLILAVNDTSLLRDYGGLATLTGVLQQSGWSAPIRLTVRSSQVVVLDVVVGRRPAEYIRPEDKPAMEARFARWWREQGGRWRPGPGAGRVGPPILLQPIPVFPAPVQAQPEPSADIR